MFQYERTGSNIGPYVDSSGGTSTIHNVRHIFGNTGSGGVSTFRDGNFPPGPVTAVWSMMRNQYNLLLAPGNINIGVGKVDSFFRLTMN